MNRIAARRANRPIPRPHILRAGVLGGAGSAPAVPLAPRAAAQTGETGSLTDVPGFLVGHATLEGPMTGCTVMVCPTNTVGSVELRGGRTGTRETDILSPLSTSPSVHALLFAGGSSYGLGAADGFARWVEERIAARVTGPYPAARVPAAVIYDLAIGDPKGRPSADDGYAACQAGLARAVHPAFTANDRDVVVVLSNGGHVAGGETIGVVAAEAVADAIRDAVRRATTRVGVPDLHTPGIRSPDDPAWSAS